MRRETLHRWSAHSRSGYAALTYYHEHIKEIQADIRAGNQLVEEIKKKYPSKLP